MVYKCFRNISYVVIFNISNYKQCRSSNVIRPRSKTFLARACIKLWNNYCHQTPKYGFERKQLEVITKQVVNSFYTKIDGIIDNLILYK